MRGLSAGDVLLTEEQFERWSDQRYVLETLVEDAEADLDAVSDPAELASALRQLVKALRDAIGAFPEPSIRG